MSALGWMEVTQSVIASIALLIGACVAWRGLDAWKAQTMWNSDHDLAKRLSDALFRYRSAVKKLRSPEITEAEKAIALKDIPLSNHPEEKAHQERTAVYDMRWRKVSAARDDLHPLLFEGQIIWAINFPEHLKPFWKLEDELFTVMRTYIERFDPKHSFELKSEFVRRIESQRFRIHLTDETNDVFFADYESSIGPLLNILRRRLGRK